MLKTSFVSLTVGFSVAFFTSCATNSEPVTPAEHTMATTPEPATTKAVTFAKSADGTQIAFESVGHGPALILVGGALSTRKGGNPLAGTLNDRFTVYTYDRRGRGDSGDTKPYAVDREIEDLAAIIEHAGNEAYLYGVSSGAALALQTAAALGPTKIPKLALYEPPYGQAEADFNQQKERINQIVQTGKPGDAATYFFSAIGTPPQVLENIKRSPEWEGMKQIDFTIAYDYAVLGNGAVPDSAKRISVPTLVLDGEKSMPFIHPTADHLAEVIPNAERKTLPGQTHQATPEVVAPVLIEFFGAGH
jgi:pimeloyl-ACP methyl ester carboxylesterase